uniref:Uncharacterized protein n=1 Tax=Candidozyma auris TaxID=498019 RepID=A0A0L0P6U9_CANAR
MDDFAAGEMYIRSRIPHVSFSPNLHFFISCELHLFMLAFKHPWWVAFSKLGNSPRYLDEWLIVSLSDTIRQKPEWEKKYTDPEIVEKWKKEFLSQNPESRYPEDVFNYVIRELKWYHELQSTPELEARKFRIGADDKILYSDEAVSDVLAKKFTTLASKFEASISEKDYHPGSDNLVVDLVHPSLYHLVYGKTKVLRDGKLAVAEFDEAIQHVKKGVADYAVSKKFQWLPAVMKLDKSTGQFVFASYINNLHPMQHGDLYGPIAEVFNEAVPALNLSLARYQSDEYVRIKTAGYGECYKEGYDGYMEKLEELIDEGADDDEWEEFEKGKSKFYIDTHPEYKSDPETKPFDLRDFDKLKVIVKMANIELLPENPEYKGGSWHVEGTINEDIVATVLYYYDVENIDDSKLSFKYAFEDPAYEQGDEQYCKDFYGILDGDLMTKYIGSVDARQGRVVVFTNSFQHHVDAFKLRDSSRPGHRKILCFFLVDPHNSVTKATDVVPPQNETWVNDEALMNKFFPGIDAKEVTTMTAKQAKESRLELMDERKVTISSGDDWENAFTRTFFLCEH